MNVPTPRHGQICNEVGRLLGNYVKAKGLGKVTSNDSGIITERDPDTMRGADVAFYRNKRFGEGPLPGPAPGFVDAGADEDPLL